MNIAAIGHLDNANLLYKNEQPLFIISLTISILVWLALLIGTFGAALIYLVLIAIGYLFAQSAFISYLRGTAVEITPNQFPDLHQRLLDCCHRLNISPVPDAYLLHGNGSFNAFATRFLGRNFVVLLSDVVDALESEPDAINFYIGHELGHIRRNHLQWGWVLAPASFLPLLGAAYSRAIEYTCDLHGLACSKSEEMASRGLAALAAGGRRWSSMDLGKYAAQSQTTRGFWMSFHELIASYPWLVKRMVKLLPQEQQPATPRRNPFAWILALFVPRVGSGGGGVSILITVAIIGILAAVALPAYQDYTVRAKVAAGLVEGTKAQEMVADFFYKNNGTPRTLADAGIAEPAASSGLRSMRIERNGVILLEFGFSPLDGKTVALLPSLNEQKRVVWKCSSRDVPPKYLPQSCRN